MAVSISGNTVTNGLIQFGQPYLLDAYTGAAAAYSLRKLRTTYYGSAIRVRRSSDNAEQDIGFVNGNLDETSLLSFTGANSGYVTKWYDQSGNARDAAQSTAGSQPRLVNAGVVDKQNGKPIITFTTQKLNIGTQIILNSTFYIGFVGNSSSTYSNNTAAALITYWSNSPSTDNPELRLGISNSFNLYWNGGYCMSSVGSANTYSLHDVTSVSGITQTIYRNGNQVATGTRSGTWNNSVTEFTLGGYNRVSAFRDGRIQELILYNSDQSSNRTGIETNINQYYNIY